MHWYRKTANKMTWNRKTACKYGQKPHTAAVFPKPQNRKKGPKNRETANNRAKNGQKPQTANIYPPPVCNFQNSRVLLFDIGCEKKYQRVRATDTLIKNASLSARKHFW